MKATIATKNGKVRVNLDDPCASHYKPGSPLYDSVAAYFDYFIDKVASEDTVDMYYGSFEELMGGAYCCPKGAIEEGIDAVLEHMEEYKLKHMSTKQYYKIDLEGVFEA